MTPLEPEARQELQGGLEMWWPDEGGGGSRSHFNDKIGGRVTSCWHFMEKKQSCDTTPKVTFLHESSGFSFWTSLESCLRGPPPASTHLQVCHEPDECVILQRQAGGFHTRAAELFKTSPNASKKEASTGRWL